MTLSVMQVFNQYVMPATIETLDQMVNKFNAASNGAIVLTTQGFDGDFLQESFWQSIHSAQRRVDRYASNASASSTDLSQNKDSAVKVAGGFGPILFEPSQLTYIQKATAEAIEVISRNFAEAIVKDQLNTAVAALVAAIQNQSAAKYDGLAVSPDLGISQITINRSHALFGDASGTLVAEVMTGSVYHKIIGQNLANNERLFVSNGVTIVDILGKAVVVTDAPALYESVSPGADKEKVLSLASGAAVVFDGGDVISNVQTNNGKNRIETTFQADYTFGLKLKGYTWDTTNGGKSPTDAELATGSNWDKTATSIKHTAGVIAIGSADVS
jgi:hypothetical protein